MGSGVSGCRVGAGWVILLGRMSSLARVDKQECKLRLRLQAKPALQQPSRSGDSFFRCPTFRNPVMEGRWVMGKPKPK